MALLEAVHEHDFSISHAAMCFLDEMLPPECENDPVKVECERSLLSFMKAGWHVLHPEESSSYVDGWPAGAVSEALEAVSLLQIRNLLVNEPPGFSKSLQVAVYWQAWQFIKSPDHAWVNITYSDDNAIRDSNKCRDLIKSEWFQRYWGNRVRIRKDQDNSGAFYLTRGGYRIATSVSGGGTGKRADTVVGDDLMKIEEFDQKAARDKANNSWDRTASTRARNPKTFCRVMVAQRGHRNDPPGHVIEQGGWTQLRIPMRYNSSKKCILILKKDDQGNLVKTWSDPREVDGELAWPERFPESYVKEQELILAHMAAGILQQDPEAITEGSIFSVDDVRFFKVEEEPDGTVMLLLEPEPGKFCRIRASECSWFQTCDTALKVGEENDFTVCATLGTAPGGYLLVWHIARRKIEVPAQYDFLLGQLPYVPAGCRILYQAVEDKASGTGILQEAALRGTPMVTLKADIDKKRRAVNASVYHRTHRLLFKQGASWLPDVHNELWAFPGGDHDDVVDAVAHGANLAKTDAILRQSNEQPLLLYPDGKEDERHPAKRPYRKDVPAIDGGKVSYAGVDVYFEDD